MLPRTPPPSPPLFDCHCRRIRCQLFVKLCVNYSASTYRCETDSNFAVVRWQLNRTVVRGLVHGPFERVTPPAPAPIDKLQICTHYFDNIRSVPLKANSLR